MKGPEVPTMSLKERSQLSLVMSFTLKNHKEHLPGQVPRSEQPEKPSPCLHQDP